MTRLRQTIFAVVAFGKNSRCLWDDIRSVERRLQIEARWSSSLFSSLVADPGVAGTDERSLLIDHFPRNIFVWSERSKLSRSGSERSATIHRNKSGGSDDSFDAERERPPSETRDRERVVIQEAKGLSLGSIVSIRKRAIQ